MVGVRVWWGETFDILRVVGPFRIISAKLTAVISYMVLRSLAAYTLVFIFSMGLCCSWFYFRLILEIDDSMAHGLHG